MMIGPEPIINTERIEVSFGIRLLYMKRDFLCKKERSQLSCRGAKVQYLGVSASKSLKSYAQ
jgi:hypothetical protein